MSQKDSILYEVPCFVQCDFALGYKCTRRLDNITPNSRECNKREVYGVKEI